MRIHLVPASPVVLIHLFAKEGLPARVFQKKARSNHISWFIACRSFLLIGKTIYQASKEDCHLLGWHLCATHLWTGLRFIDPGHGRLLHFWCSALHSAVDGADGSAGGSQQEGGPISSSRRSGLSVLGQQSISSLKPCRGNCQAETTLDGLGGGLNQNPTDDWNLASG